MTFTRTFLGATATLALTAGAALADPAIIYDLGGKFDKSFNESAYNGAQRWADETGESFDEFEITSDAQREQAIRRFAEGFHARVVQHECDHLIGRLYPSRIQDFTKFGYTDVLFPGLEAGDD